MSEALLGTVISAVIAGVFSLISKGMELSQNRDGTETLRPLDASPPTLAARGAINYGMVLRHIGILQFIVNLAGFLVGTAIVGTEASLDTILIVVLLIGTIVLSAGFFWVALSVEKAVKWEHMSIVAVGVAITTILINSIILQVPPSLEALALALIQTFVSMGIGGFIAGTMKS